jgi:outer membrane protein assembly factor BamE (lipoprotein component of BamABCDE complex)
MPSATVTAWLAAGLGALLALVGCDQKRIDRLEEGLSTEADVRREFGEPATVFAEPDGSRTLEYPRQPEGQVNYLITIAPDGRMSALRQVLQPATFAQVRPGLDKAQVRRLLGRPARVTPYPLKREEEWDWRWRNGMASRWFTVVFDADGRVVRSAESDDRSREGDGQR